MNDLSIALLVPLRFDIGPLGILFILPEHKFLAPIGASSTPEEEKGGKGFAGVTSQFMNHETNTLIGDGEAIHPS